MWVDMDSSTNIIFLSVLKDIGIENVKMENVQVSLVGFSGEHVSTIGTICLPFYAECVNQMVKFMVGDCP